MFFFLRCLFIFSVIIWPLCLTLLFCILVVFLICCTTYLYIHLDMNQSLSLYINNNVKRPPLKHSGVSLIDCLIESLVSLKCRTQVKTYWLQFHPLLMPCFVSLCLWTSCSLYRLPTPFYIPASAKRCYLSDTARSL
jgi:hypothetical protein